MYRRILSGMLILLMVFQLNAEKVYAIETIITKNQYQSELKLTEEKEIGQEESGSESEAVQITRILPITEEETEVSIESETKTNFSIESETENETESQIETESQTEPEIKTENETESQIETETQTEPETKTENKTELQTEPETNTENETESQIETETKDQKETESQIETENEIESQIETEFETEIKSEMETDDNEVEAFEEGDSDCLFQAGGYRVLNEDAGFETEISLFSVGDIDVLAEQMYTALKERATSIPVKEYEFYWDNTEDRKQLLGIYYAVVNDHPDLYYARTGYGVSYNKTSKLITKISPQYFQNIDDTAFFEAVQKAKSVVTEDMDDLQKAIAVHEYIVLNCEYDKERLANNTIPKESYSAYGVLVNRIAVCQGYALAYKYLMNEFGIECYIVTSDTMNHAWNIVAIDGNLYHLDATWNDPTWDKHGLVRHSYLLQSDEEFQKSSVNHSRHYDWYVTKGSGIVDIQADGTKYDNAFWRDVYSPLVYDRNNTHNYYYISNGKELQSRECTNKEINTEPSRLLTIDTPYSGLALDGSRLYYNTSRNISYIDLDSALPYIAQVRYALPKEDTDKIYGFTKSDNKIQYVKRASYTLSERSTIYLLDDSNQTEGEVYTVTFQDQFGTIFDSQIVAAGGYAIPPDSNLIPPTGYTFSYWRGRYSNIVQDETVLAVYLKIAYQIDYVLNGGINSSKNIVSYNVETDTFVLEPPTRAGYDFVGWYADSEYKTVVTAISKGSTGDQTFYARWTPKIYQIQYELEGGSNHPENPTEYHVEMDDIVLKEPTREHYHFMGWYLEKTFQNKVQIIKKGSVEAQIFYAKWEPNTYQITYILNGGVNSANNPTTYQITSENIVFQEPEREDFLFAGWYTDETYQTKVTGIEKGSGGDCVFYARWERYYEVSFLDVNDRVLSKQIIIEGESAKPPEVLAPEGYQLQGWDHNCQNIQEDLIVRPIYVPISYTITYVLGYHYCTNAAFNPEVYTIETPTVLLKAPEYDNPDLTFLGWFRAPNGQECITSIEKGSTGNLTLYAKWEGIWADWGNYSQTYTGNAVTFEQMAVYSGLEPLRRGLDYTISYKNNVYAADENAKKAPTVIVTGKGNYEGNYIHTFSINPVDISQPNVIKIEKMAISLNEKQKPIPTVLWKNTKLVPNKDFVVSYLEAFTKEGEYRVILTGKGNFTGTTETTLTVIDNTKSVAMRSVKITKKIPDQRLVEGVAIINENMITLQYKGEVLIPHQDYEFDMVQYTDAGMQYVTIRGTGEKYIGELVTTFRVQGTKVSALKAEPVIYTGNAVKPIIRDKEGRLLIEGKDYVINSITSTERVGTAKINISGKNAYYGTTTKSFRITPRSIDDTAVSIAFVKDSNIQPYEKNGAKPKLQIRYGGQTLKEGTDYVLSYRNNKKIGAFATVTITGKKNFRAKTTRPFVVGKGSLADTTVIVADKVASTKVGGYVSTPVLKDINGNKLAAGKDYDKNIVYKCDGFVLNKKADRLLAGAIVTIEITGKGNYEGTTTTASYRILAAGKNLSKAKVTVKSKFYYNGGNVILSEEDFVVKIGKKTLPTDAYEILPETYLNNDKKGTAQVTIQGVGSYGGTKTIRFKINAQKVNRSAAS